MQNGADRKKASIRGKKKKVRSENPRGREPKSFFGAIGKGGQKLGGTERGPGKKEGQRREDRIRIVCPRGV